MELQFGMELIVLIAFSMLGQLTYILAGLYFSINVNLESFNWTYWKKRNLLLSVVALVLSGISIIFTYTSGVEITYYSAIMQGIALDSFLKLFKPQT